MMMKTELIAVAVCALLSLTLSTKVYAQAPNVALNKPATQSSTGFGGEASRAVDGNTSGDFWSNSVSHTGGGDSEAWWRVDLQRQYTVSRIRIFNRTDCCSLRLTGALVQLEQETGRVVWSTTITGDQAKTANFTLELPNIPGTAVRVLQKNKADGGVFLALAEVQVYAADAQGPDVAPNNVALKKPATQSSTGWGGDASRAVDGNTNGDFWKNSVSQTSGADSDAWWRVDLQGRYTVDRIQIFNRTDCCNLRLTGAVVQIEQGTDNVAWSTTITEGQARPDNVTLSVPKIAGTAVRVLQKNKMDGGTYLALAEVRVYGGGQQPPRSRSVVTPTATDAARFEAKTFRVDGRAPADSQDQVKTVSAYFEDEMSRDKFPDAIRVQWTDRSLEIKWLDWWDYRQGDLSVAELLNRARIR